MIAYQHIEARVAALKVQHPELGLSFGYIGNVDRHGDDRGWRIFTKVPDGRSAYSTYSFGDYGTGQLQSMLEVLDTPRFAQFIAKAKLDAPRVRGIAAIS